MFFQYLKKYKKSNNLSRYTQTTHTNNAVLKDINDLKLRDYNFSSSRFISKVQNIFLILQDASSNKNLETLKIYETDEFYNIHKTQIDYLIDNNRTRYVDNIAILESKIMNYYTDENFDILEVLFDINAIDYTINNTTKVILNGNCNILKNKKYIYTFIRPKRAITIDNYLLVSYCPSCGAPTNINASSTCEY
ncbi:MAG: Tim44 domain-containing protein, partial [Romboutsia sp.]|nr:Tim44 domain-containing protein [Romboutsia sp.]